MNSKKLLSAAMASAIAMSLAVPAFAAQSTTITSTYEEVPIEVSVPQSAVVKINPYKLPTTFYFTEAGKISNKHVDNGVDISVPGAAFATQPMVLINYGQTDLDVSAGITITDASGVVFDKTSAADATKVDKKYVDLYVEAGAVSENFADVIEADGHEIALSDLADGWANFTWGVGQGNSVVTTGTGKTAKSEAAEKKIGTLTKAEEISTGEDKGKMAVTDGGIMPIRLNGTVTQKPTTAWETGDSFSGTITYNFEVAQAAAEGEGEGGDT